MKLKNAITLSAVALATAFTSGDLYAQKKKSKPKKGMIIAIWSFLGIVIGIGTIFAKDFMKAMKNRSAVPAQE